MVTGQSSDCIHLPETDRSALVHQQFLDRPSLKGNHFRFEPDPFADKSNHRPLQSSETARDAITLERSRLVGLYDFGTLHFSGAIFEIGKEKPEGAESMMK